MSPYGNNAKNRRRKPSASRSSVPSKPVLKGDLKAINECLDLGIPLEMISRGETRRFTFGDITDEVKGKWVRTKHRSPDLNGFIWINGTAVHLLAEQARTNIANKDAILERQRKAREEWANR